ncbi:NADH-quinone oxidoreductase subunit C [Streptacidiphilus sp. MAP12-16]|uniref:NADH-quinone oxidoreductase subunit C n=1 Tax=Streptacidiphilus sp. MAP12-16 TaxID=3156300 RepID=UPI003515EF39
MSPDQAPGQVPDQTPDETPDQGPDEATGRGPDEATGRGPDEATDPSSDQATEQASEQAAEQARGGIPAEAAAETVVEAPADSPAGIAAAIGPWATAEEAFALLTVDVPAEHWIEALTAARDRLGLAFFDWLSAVDELAEGFSVAAHLAHVGTPSATPSRTTSPASPASPIAGRAPGLRRILLRTRIPRDAAALPTATGVYAGASWHERETHEMFGIDFVGHPHLATLLLPDGFEGHPLRKEFVLAARVAKAWPGAKEPGESDHGTGDGAPTPARRRMLPPGVPDPNEWGPLAGTLPPVPERPARGAATRGARAAAGAGAGAAAGAEGVAGAAPAPAERPVRADRPRRTRSVDQGSASQTPPSPPPPTPDEEAAAPPSPEAPSPDAPSPEAPSPDAPWQVAPPKTGDDA